MQFRRCLHCLPAVHITHHTSHYLSGFVSISVAAAVVEGTWQYENGANTAFWLSNPQWVTGEPNDSGGVEDYSHVWGTQYKLNDAPNNPKAM